MTLIGHLFKAVPWISWVPSAALIALILWGTDPLMPDFASKQLYLRAALLVAALGLCFAYDDPAAYTTDSSPSSLRMRRAIRTWLALGPWLVLVGATLLVVGRGMDPVFILSEEVGNEFPIGRAILEATTLGAWGLAIAAVISKRWDEEPGKFASAGLLAIYAASWAIPEQWKPWANSNDQRWETALPWWWVALAVGALIVVAFSWDSRIGWRLRLGSRPDESSGQSVTESSYSLTSGE
jgi:hypothetical protein